MSEDKEKDTAPAYAGIVPTSKNDPYIWGTYIALILVSIVELFSASSQEVHVDDIYGPIIRHAIFLGIGLVIMLALQRTYFLRIYQLIPLYVVGSLGMIIWVNLFGQNINNAVRSFSVLGFSVFPADFLKLACALGLVWIITRNQIPGKRGITHKGFIYCVFYILACAGMLVEQGLTNTLLLICIAFSVMFIGGIGRKYIIQLLAIFGIVGAIYGGYKYVKHIDTDKSKATETEQLDPTNGAEASAEPKDRTEMRVNRIANLFRSDKYKDKITKDNQQEQLSFIAQARGGLTGVGIGNSRETARLPLAMSDYIYAIILEELGAVVGIGILLLYLFLLGRAGTLALSFKSSMPCLMVISCALVICYQALFHICIVVGVFPVSGQPLPFISKGGSSIIAFSIAMGVMLSTSRWAARKNDIESSQRELNTLPENVAAPNPAQLEP